MNFKLTGSERNWILYDVGNSAFTLLVSTIMPIYFNYLAGDAGLSEVEYLAYWGYAASIATLLVAIMGPIFGSLSDMKGFKRPVFIISIVIGAAGCFSLGLARQWLVFLVIYIIAKVGYSGSLIFYDSMLSDVTTGERMDNISAQGYAWGYIGSCVPFGLCLGLVLGAEQFGLAIEEAMMLAFFINAVWWVGMAFPLIRNYKQKYFVQRQPNAIRNSLRRLGRTLQRVRKEKKVFLFLLAFFFYIDGVYTIIDMATAYGSALGLDSTGLEPVFRPTNYIKKGVFCTSSFKCNQSVTNNDFFRLYPNLIYVKIVDEEIQGRNKVYHPLLLPTTEGKAW